MCLKKGTQARVFEVKLQLRQKDLQDSPHGCCTVHVGYVREEHYSASPPHFWISRLHSGPRGHDAGCE